MALSLDQLTRLLASSGLMSADDLSGFTGSLSDRPADAETLARKLVEAKKLTPYQATEIWEGRTQQLTLGDYVILEKLGAGGMGEVYKARHRIMERVVALKVLPESVTKNENAVKRFRREVVAAAKLTHPNIVTAHDAGETNGSHYLIMECIEGQSLSAIVKQQGPATVEQSIDYVLQAARGLHYAHQQGVIHRDVKPANLLLDKSGTVKVLDMGLARIEDDSVDAATQAGLTGTGTIMGTIDYMSPEQAEDTKHAGPQADIYSLGATLYFLLVGKPVVQGDTLGKKLKVLMTGVGLPDSISSECSSVSGELDAVFHKMTAFDTKDRYRSMTEVIADLEALNAGGAPSSASAAGIHPVAAGRSDDSTMQSSFNNLDRDAAAPKRTALVPPKTAAAATAVPETVAISVGDATHPAFKQTTAFAAAQDGPQNRKLVIGSSVAVVLAIAAIVWGLSGGGDNEPTERGESNPPGTNLAVNADGSLGAPKPAAAKLKTPPIPPTDPDRVAAEWVLRVGGIIRTDKDEFRSAKELPAETFRITQIHLTGTKGISGDALSLLNGLPKLGSLFLESTDVDDAGLGHVAGVKTIKLLSLSNTQVSGAGLKHIAGLTNINNFSAADIQIDDSDLKYLKNWRQLNYLRLDQCPIGDDGLVNLKELTNLNRLYLNNTHVSDAGIEHLKGLSKLIALGLSETKVTAAGVADLQKALPNCKINWDGAK